MSKSDYSASLRVAITLIRAADTVRSAKTELNVSTWLIRARCMSITEAVSMSTTEECQAVCDVDNAAAEERALKKAKVGGGVR